MHAALQRSHLGYDEVDALLQRYPERDCTSDVLLTARKTLLERQKSLTQRQKEAGAWKTRLQGLTNQCSLHEAEAVLLELGSAFTGGDIALDLAKEHSALHLYHATLRAGAIEKLSALRGSRDTTVLLVTIAEYANVSEPEVRGLCSSLSERVATLEKEAKSHSEWRLRLTQLATSGNVEAMEAALSETGADPVLVEALTNERAKLQEQVSNQVAAAVAALNDMRSTTMVGDIDQALAEYLLACRLVHIVSLLCSCPCPCPCCCCCCWCCCC